MPRILSDFECSNCTHVFEDFTGPEIWCPECGSKAVTRLITGTRLDPRLGVNPDSFPTMGDKWARVRKQKQQIDAKRARDHGE